MALPLIAIVGRPNVGKSMLFNKIIGRRLSIVEDTPGVTRDRIYGESEWVGRKFRLVDTGGIEPNTDSQILSFMREQAQIAIDNADVIIFVTDIKTGLTASDQEVASMLQRSRKPIVLAVNKMDSVGAVDPDFYEFYNLGLGDPVAVSAVHGHGTGDLLDECIKYFPPETDEEDDSDVVQVAIIGKPNVGKSSLTNRILGEERVIVSNVAGTTRDAIDSYFENQYGKYNFIDTAGIRETSDTIEALGIERSFKALDQAQIVILMYDLTRDLKDFEAFYQEIAPRLTNKSVILAMNKCDVLPASSLPTFSFPTEGWHQIAISAKGKLHIAELQQLLTEVSSIPTLHQSDIIVTNARHFEALTHALEAIHRVQEGLNSSLSGDFISQDLRECIFHLSDIVGEVTTDQVLGNIFQHFCIGK